MHSFYRFDGQLLRLEIAGLKLAARRIRDVSAPSRFGLGRFGLNLDVGRFGLFWWVVSALGRFGP